MSTEQGENVVREMLSEMARMPKRHLVVLMMRYGIAAEFHTLEQIAEEFNISRERVRQLEVKAVRNLAKAVLK